MVLLILAGISIQSLTNTGIFKNAENVISNDYQALSYDKNNNLLVPSNLSFSKSSKLLLNANASIITI